MSRNVGKVAPNVCGWGHLLRNAGTCLRYFACFTLFCKKTLVLNYIFGGISYWKKQISTFSLQPMPDSRVSPNIARPTKPADSATYRQDFSPPTGNPDGATSTVEAAEHRRIVVWQTFAAMLTPSIQRVVEFAKRIPGGTWH